MIANENGIDKSSPLEIIVPVFLVWKGWGLFCPWPFAEQRGGSSIAIVTQLASGKHLCGFFSHCRLPQILGIVSPHHHKLPAFFLISYQRGEIQHGQYFPANNRDR